jgi:hypothetical protein
LTWKKSGSLYLCGISRAKIRDSDFLTTRASGFIRQTILSLDLDAICENGATFGADDGNMIAVRAHKQKETISLLTVSAQFFQMPCWRVEFHKWKESRLGRAAILKIKTQTRPRILANEPASGPLVKDCESISRSVARPLLKRVSE